MKTTLSLALAAAVTLVTAPISAAQPAQTQPAAHVHAPSAGETDASVPELSEFHEVIYKVWHEAWPKKDLEMLSSLTPQIDAGAAKVEKAVLPGILRDKKQAWDDGVKKLGVIVAEYKGAAGAKDLTKLLDAGEKLHAQYEALVRVVRPVLKEVDDFHAVLYRLWHYELDSFDLPTIQTSALQLKEKMTPLNAAALPERMKSKQEAFEARRKDLNKAVDDLALLAGAGKDDKAIKDAISAVHTRYQALEQVF